ncbi:hypothetical protein DFQ27_006158 [Actinomortierella ambigua]|uniref:Uncharacterized protein n=1 Tax=Actinomortierella ambigua TaxID=1343610 RepID=A0A9P6QI74_9FUNG|nr:hypothetical protein DFQ27_006158 [Actinomortierella ambigua]
MEESETLFEGVFGDQDPTLLWVRDDQGRLEANRVIPTVPLRDVMNYRWRKTTIRVLAKIDRVKKFRLTTTGAYFIVSLSPTKSHLVAPPSSVKPEGYSPPLTLDTCLDTALVEKFLTVSAEKLAKDIESEEGKQNLKE